MEEEWYRVTDYLTAYYDPWGEDWEQDGPSTVNLRVARLPVLKHTLKGVWLMADQDKRFVRRVANRRYACPTLDEAFVSFIARKDRQIRIYDARLVKAKEARHLARIEMDKLK